jgi:beta-mannosidase
VSVAAAGSRPAADVRGDVHAAPGGEWRVTARVPVDAVRSWWPHTHGAQPLYDVQIDVDGQRLPVGRVGFRSVQAERGDGGFTLRVNGVRVFCRGACWTPPDPVGWAADRETVEAELRRLRDAGLNMVRVTGTTSWQDRAFWDCCDELGLLVWQDCMLATLDPPDDDVFLASVRAEVRQELADLAGRPALAVVSGGSETEQQPTYAGLPADRRTMPVLDDVVPAVVAEVVPGVPFVTSTPTGGGLPTHVGTGVAHYFGVGAYLRSPEQLRRDDVRFAAECLAFATPPERAAVEEWFAGPAVAGHDPAWKRAVPRDPGASWDFEDVTQHYVRTIFGVDPLALRRIDPDRALDLNRAVVAHLVRETLSEWRRPASRCAGAIVLQSRDLAPGAGWGLLDAAGRAKSTWFALRDVAAPRVLLVTDEGLDGLALHLVNDSPEPMTGRLVVEVLDRAGRSVLGAERDVEIDAAHARTWSVDGLLGVFRDLTHAHRFGPVQYDALVARFAPTSGGEPLERVHVIDPALRHEPHEVGLSAQAYQDGEGAWWLRVQADRLARWVNLEVAGFEATQSWFHLAPRHPRTLALLPAGGDRPRGTVRAVGALDVAAIELTW